MEEWHVALLLRPIGALIFFAAIVIPIELIIRKVMPEGRLKNVLFDRTFPKRQPKLYMFWWLVLVGGLYLTLAICANYFDTNY